MAVTYLPPRAASICRWCHGVPHAFQVQAWRWQDASRSGAGLRLERWCKLKNAACTLFQDRPGADGWTWKRGVGWVSEEQKRRSPTAPVIGLPRLSFPRDQSHRNCLLPHCSTNQLSYRPLISCPSLTRSLARSLGVGKTICAETPVVLAERRVWHWQGEVWLDMSGGGGHTQESSATRSFRLLALKGGSGLESMGRQYATDVPLVHRG